MDKFNIENIQGSPIVKKWQSNGYYPVEKIVVSGEEVEVLHQKIMDGKLQFVNNHCSYTIESLLYRLNKNSYIFATNENGNNFN